MFITPMNSLVGLASLCDHNCTGLSSCDAWGPWGPWVREVRGVSWLWTVSTLQGYWRGRNISEQSPAISGNSQVGEILFPFGQIYQGSHLSFDDLYGESWGLYSDDSKLRIVSTSCFYVSLSTFWCTRELCWYYWLIDFFHLTKLGFCCNIWYAYLACA